MLAGPDHLSALAALSVGNSWRAFSLGFRWGIGHSSGLILVAIIFILLKGELDLKKLGRYCDSLVGAFMIILGCYGVLCALKVFREKNTKRDTDLLLKKLSVSSSESHHLESGTSSGSSSSHSEIDSYPLIENQNNHNQHDSDYLENDCKCLSFIDMRDPFVQRVVSFSIGLLHGVAGPGNDIKSVNISNA